VMAYRRSRHSYNPIMHVGVVQRPLWTYAGNTSDPVRFQNFSSPHCHAVRPRRDGSDLPRDALASSLRPRRLNASARVVSSSSDVEFDAATAVNLRRRRRRARRSARLRLRPRPCRNGWRRRSTSFSAAGPGRSVTVVASTSFSTASSSSSSEVAATASGAPSARYRSRNHSASLLGGRQRGGCRRRTSVEDASCAVLSSRLTMLTLLLLLLVMTPRWTSINSNEMIMTRHSSLICTAHTVTVTVATVF